MRVGAMAAKCTSSGFPPPHDGRDGTKVEECRAMTRLAPIASSLFFLSGGTALAYQIIWFKRFSHVFGNTSLAMAGVVAGFLLGLGLGARWLGGWADRVRSPLMMYGVCEVGIGILALAVPFQLTWLQGLTEVFHGALQPHP